jgi:hypothetical protein
MIADMEMDRAKLLKSISRVFPAIARREIFEQATKLAFKDGHLCAYNDEISIFDRLPETDGLDGAVDGKHLYSLLNKLAVDQVSLEQDNSKLHLRAGRVKASFDLAPVTLPFGEIDRSGEDSELGEDFANGLKLIASTCARDMSHPVLTCISMKGDLIESGDGYRAARLLLEDIDLPKFLLQVTAAEVVARYAVERAAVSDSSEWVRFSTSGNNTLIYARAFEGDFPDLAGYFVLEDGIDVALPDTLSKVLDRAQIFSEREHAIDEVVQIGIRPNQITVSSAYDGGQFSEIVRSDQKVSADFSIHPDFLVEVLKTGTTCIVGEKRVKFTGPSWQHVIALR